MPQFTTTTTQKLPNAIDLSNNLVAWYDGPSFDNGGRKIWYDKSGNNRNAITTINKYIYSGGVVFSSSDEQFDISGSIPLNGNDGFTVFIVANNSITSGKQITYLLQGNLNSPLFVNNYTQNSFDFITSGVTQSISTEQLSNTTYILALTFKKNNLYRIYFNDTTYIDASANISLDNFNYTTIGGDSSDSTYNFTGRMYELIFYNRDLTYTEMNGVYNYLYNKYITALKPYTSYYRGIIEYIDTTTYPINIIPIIISAEEVRKFQDSFTRPTWIILINPIIPTGFSQTLTGIAIDNYGIYHTIIYNENTVHYEIVKNGALDSNTDILPYVDYIIDIIRDKQIKNTYGYFNRDARMAAEIMHYKIKALEDRILALENE
jgi:hypothetical protein